MLKSTHGFCTTLSRILDISLYHLISSLGMIILDYIFLFEHLCMTLLTNLILKIAKTNMEVNKRPNISACTDYVDFPSHDSTSAYFRPTSPKLRCCQVRTFIFVLDLLLSSTGRYSYALAEMRLHLRYKSLIEEEMTHMLP